MSDVMPTMNNSKTLTLTDMNLQQLKKRMDEIIARMEANNLKDSKTPKPKFKVVNKFQPQDPMGDFALTYLKNRKII